MELHVAALLWLTWKEKKENDMQAIAKYMNKTGNDISTDFEFDGSRQDFLKKSSEFLLDAMIPGQLSILFPGSNIMQAVYKITKRGTYKEDGKTYPSMYVPTIIFGPGLDSLPEGTPCGKCYLTCVHPESNNYKAYEIETQGDKIICRYGSIDDMSHGKAKTVEYKSDLYWVRYYEKLSKGYIDQSEILYTDEEETKPTERHLFSHPLYEELYKYSKQMVSGILLNPMKITRRQVDECRKLWNSLGEQTDVKGFNKILEKLVALSPRVRRPLHDQVNMYFADSEKDFTKIIDFEDNLINAMEGSIAGTQSVSMENGQMLPILIEADEEVKADILATLPRDIASRVEVVYKVIDIKRQQQFDLYCHKRKITNIQKLWHGSKNENWLSIIQNGLLLNPNATITGKMFGNGIYFAPNPKKAYGYTSCNGSYWAKGIADCGFMGLYDTAVGNPHYSTTWGSSAEAETKRLDKDCLYAKKGTMGLYNDEVVFYNEKAVCLSYLVKIKS